VARNLVENCDGLKVRNLWTIGGPHRGVAMFPHCEDGIWCDTLTSILDNYAYFNISQDETNPAAYWRDPTDLKKYLEESIFLPLLNNERDFSQERKDRMLALNHAVFVMNEDDHVVYPKESAVFGELQYDYTTVLPKEQTELWQKDLIGIK
jgi:palmitoyl-protein thioesterase